jgi:hypothetical protein
MNTDVPAPATYTPGYPLPKVLLCLGGLVLFCLGAISVWPMVSLFATGRSVVAESVRVVMVAADGTETVFTSDAALRDEVERQNKERDRTARFWPVLRFHAGDGRQVEVRGSTGYRIPLGNQAFLSIRGADGLPVPVRLWHDPARPERFVIPWMWNTWFLPLLFLLFGGMTTVMGFLLWRHASKPIEIPDLSATADAGKPAAH